MQFIATNLYPVLKNTIYLVTYDTGQILKNYNTLLIIHLYSSVANVLQTVKTYIERYLARQVTHTQAHKIPENKLEHEVFTVETEQCLEQTQRDHAQLQRRKETKIQLPITPRFMKPCNVSQKYRQNCFFIFLHAKLTRELLLMRVSSVSRMVSLSW